jgi:hypothetical protein
MTLVTVENSDRYLTKYGLTWEQFKTLQSAFAEISGVRLMYCEGTLEIMGARLIA